MDKASNPSKSIEVCVGSRVTSSDGTDMGVVSELSGDLFHVDAPRAADFWLNKRTVEHSDDRETRLAYSEQQLEPFKVEKPEASAGSPIAAEQLETFDSASDQERRRADTQRGHA